MKGAINMITDTLKNQYEKNFPATEHEFQCEVKCDISLNFTVSKSFSVDGKRKFLVEVTYFEKEVKIILKTYTQCLHLHKLLVSQFGDIIPSFPYAIWMVHTDEDVANSFNSYFFVLCQDARIIGSFAMKLFLEQFDLKDKTCIITGASSGIGKQTALQLAQLHAHVILACRNKEKTYDVIEMITKETGNSNVEFMKLNLASLTSVNTFISKFIEKGLPLHILVLNAGIMSTMPLLTEDGFESIIGVNHIGHFALTKGLLYKLKESAPSRIICVTAESHKNAAGVPMNMNAITKPTSSTTDIIHIYAQSKLANCLFIKELGKRLPPNVTANLVHPGIVGTALYRDLPEFIQWGMKATLMDAEEGAYSTIACAVDPNLTDTTGAYFDYDGKSIPTSTLADSASLATQMWKFTEECIRLNQ